MPKAIEKARPIPLIRDSAHQIWLAGLGALSLAEDQSGKLFKTLVKRGKTFEDETKGRMEEIRAKLDVRKAAADTVDRITETWDGGVTDVMHRLGLPTKREIDGLAKRVDRLTKTLEAPPAKTTARRRPRKRTEATA